MIEIKAPNQQRWCGTEQMLVLWLLAISFFNAIKRNWNEKDRLHKEHLACFFLGVG